MNRWTNSNQRQRWLATVLLDIEPRLRRVKGYLVLASFMEGPVSIIKDGEAHDKECRLTAISELGAIATNFELDFIHQDFVDFYFLRLYTCRLFKIWYSRTACPSLTSNWGKHSIIFIRPPAFGTWSRYRSRLSQFSTISAQTRDCPLMECRRRIAKSWSRHIRQRCYPTGFCHGGQAGAHPGVGDSEPILIDATIPTPLNGHHRRRDFRVWYL